MSTHAHHWRIDTPAGPVSQAVCLTCDATRLFENWHREEKPSRERWRNGLKTITEKRYTTRGDFVR